MSRRGLPHSEIPGSKLVCSSPRLIAAYCVLHRLLAPRHSPYALSSLTIGMELRSLDASRRPCVPIPLPTLTSHTACVCGSEKLPFAGYSVVKEPSKRLALRFAADPLAAIFLEPVAYPRLSSSNLRPSLSDDRQQGLVENTGLEPVTSWLQTRRSPS